MTSGIITKDEAFIASFRFTTAALKTRYRVPLTWHCIGKLGMLSNMFIQLEITRVHEFSQNDLQNDFFTLTVID